MKPKATPGSKIHTKQPNTNKKKQEELSSTSKGFDTSLIRKNEFALIIFGALFLTVIVFFLFFRSSSSETVEMQVPPSSPSYTELENRIQALEKSLAESSDRGLNSEEKKSDLAKIDLLAQRVSRLETAFSAKFDSVIDRMAGMEKTIGQLKKTEEVSAAKVSVKTPVSKPPAKKSAVVSKPAVKKPLKKTELFHTVKKGETLYSISRKYNTTVPELRKLNNLSENAKIYVGNNLLVR